MKKEQLGDTVPERIGTAVMIVVVLGGFGLFVVGWLVVMGQEFGAIGVLAVIAFLVYANYSWNRKNR